MSTDERCETCRFYVTTGAHAECRRRPPVATYAGRPFPTVWRNDWCGEYERGEREVDDGE
jgi:hypothetical protein